MANSKRHGAVPRYYAWFSAMGLLFLFMGCVPKSPLILTSISAIGLEPVRASIDPPGKGKGQPEEPDAIVEAKPAGTAAARAVDIPENKLVLPPEPTPEARMEAALAAYQHALERWRDGDADGAFASLDEAYESILSIDEDANPEVLQEKDDLRFLISRRIIEIHAAQRTTIGDSSKEIPLNLNEHVEREIKKFTGPEKAFFIESYRRSGPYRTMILEALRKEGLPEQLVWLPLIESGFKTRALSRARALGLWQFIPSTGYRYGLSRDQWIDERMDPEKSTRAALQYLRELHNLFGDWLTALAAYNCGPGRVQRVIRAQQVNYLDHFWDLYGMLPRETARYVPRFLAALKILEDPTAYGITLPELNPPYETETLSIARNVRLQDVASSLGVSYDRLRAMNPELRYGVTPPSVYALRVPSGLTEEATVKIAALPEYTPPRMAYSTHVVRRGDSLSLIAKRYNTSSQHIVRLNKLKSEHRIWPGQKLRVPHVRSRNTKPPKVVYTAGPNQHVVAEGETLWRISQKYGTSVEKLRALNNMDDNTVILGQVLKVRPENAKVKVYLVKRGDTLAQIARRHGIALQALLNKNGMRANDRIHPNQKLQLP